jgi:hypothetical protein
MNRRDLIRRTLLGAAGLAAAETPAPAREIPADADASKDLARPDWKPIFLDDHQNQTLIAVSDLIIPETETPGAKSALVNRFLDQLLAVETSETQRSFLSALAYLDGESISRYRAAFVYLPVEQQTDVLMLMAYPHTLETWDESTPTAYPGHAHFTNLKDWVSRAFFSSPAGMQTLGYSGAPGGVFEGCQHSNGHS